MKYCTSCGCALNENDMFCTQCGQRVNITEEKKNESFFSAMDSLEESASMPPVRPCPEPMYTAPEVIYTDTHVPESTAPVEYASEPVVTKPTPPVRKMRRISVWTELKLLLRQGILVLLGEKRNLIISLLFPFIAAIITVWIAGEDMFVTYESTKSACFILVCAAIWGGLFNSIQSLVKERENIRRDYVSGVLRIECYMTSRVILQVALCFMQSFVLFLSIPAVSWIYGNDLPSDGVIGGSAMVEYFISLFLIMLASDALGLMISSIVKKEELASKLAPYILIAQLLFSGVLFKLEGASNVFSGIMISRWGMEALGSISGLNDQTTKIFKSLEADGVGEAAKCACATMTPDGTCPCTTGIMDSLKNPSFEEAFEAAAGHLAVVFLIMILFVVVPLVVGDLMLHRVKKDGRG